MLLQQTQQPNGLPSFVFLIVIGAIFYLIVFMPARRSQKKLQEMIGGLKVGDKIVTSGGIYGTIVGFRGDKGDRIQVRLAENVKVEMSRNAVAALQGPEEEQTL